MTGNTRLTTANPLIRGLAYHDRRHVRFGHGDHADALGSDRRLGRTLGREADRQRIGPHPRASTDSAGPGVGRLDPAAVAIDFHSRNTRQEHLGGSRRRRRFCCRGLPVLYARSRGPARHRRWDRIAAVRRNPAVCVCDGPRCSSHSVRRGGGLVREPFRTSALPEGVRDGRRSHAGACRPVHAECVFFCYSTTGRLIT
jgi:hypothetical protein